MKTIIEIIGIILVVIIFYRYWGIKLHVITIFFFCQGFYAGIQKKEEQKLTWRITILGLLGIIITTVQLIIACIPILNLVVYMLRGRKMFRKTKEEMQQIVLEEKAYKLFLKEGSFALKEKILKILLKEDKTIRQGNFAVRDKLFKIFYK